MSSPVAVIAHRSSRRVDQDRLGLTAFPNFMIPSFGKIVALKDWFPVPDMVADFPVKVNPTLATSEASRENDQPFSPL
jgi:hypothetical protein